MGIIESYILFSLTTAIVGVIQLYRLVHKKLKETHKEDLITKSPIRSYIIFGIFGFITAPLMILVLIFPSVASTFIEAMYDGLVEDKK